MFIVHHRDSALFKTLNKDEFLIIFIEKLIGGNKTSVLCIISDHNGTSTSKMVSYRYMANQRVELF